MQETVAGRKLCPKCVGVLLTKALLLKENLQNWPWATSTEGWKNITINKQCLDQSQDSCKALLRLRHQSRKHEEEQAKELFEAETAGSGQAYQHGHHTENHSTHVILQFFVSQWPIQPCDRIPAPKLKDKIAWSLFCLKNSSITYI